VFGNNPDATTIKTGHGIIEHRQQALKKLK
jgi:hypothetical protein